MEVLKRCVRKLTYYKGRTALMTLFYAAVFVVFFIVATAYTAVQNEIRQAEATVGCSVCVQKMEKMEDAVDASSRARLHESEVEMFISQELVKSYNSTACGTVYYDIQKGADRADYEYPVVVCRDSSQLPHFAYMGCHLLEGEGITEENEDQNVVVISERVAREENLHIGDKMTLHGAPELIFTAGKQIEMEVVGIFSVDSDIVPDAEAIKRSNPEYILFLPMQALIDAGILFGGINKIWLFFDDMEDTAAYVDWYEENYSEPVLHENNFVEYYEYQWNEAGYRKIIKPLLELRRLCEALLLIVGIAAALIIWNVGAMALRAARRESAILQSCGERTGKVLWQNLLEQAVPIACAAILAALAASAASGRVAQMLTREYMGGESRLAEMSNQKYDMEVISSLNIVDRMSSRTSAADTKLQELERPDAPAGRWAGALLAGLAAILAALWLQGHWYFRKKKIHEMMQEE